MARGSNIRNMKIPGIVNIVFLLVVCIFGFVLLAPFVIAKDTSSIMISSALIGCTFIVIIYASNYIEKKNHGLEEKVTELENKRLELERLVERNSKIEEMISSLVSMFIQPKDTDNIILRTLEKTTALCNAGNSYLFLFKADGTPYLFHNWKNENFRNKESIFETRNLSNFPKISERINDRQTTVVSKESSDIGSIQSERRLITNHGLESLIAIPVESNEELAGFISIENYTSTTDTCQNYLPTLKVVSELIGMALSHRSFLKDLSIFRDLINRSNDFIFIIDMEKDSIIDVNQTACQELGYTREEFLAMEKDGISELFDDKFWENDLRNMFGDRYLEPNKTLERKDGTILPVEMNVTFSTLDQHNYALAIVRDITKRKDIESILAKTKEVMELALEGADLGMWDWNLRTNEVMYNDRWGSMMGYDPEDIEQNIEEWKRLVHPDDLKVVNDTINKHLTGETPLFESEFRMKNHKDKWQWILARGKLTEWDKNNEPFRFTGTTMDLDERKRVEEELRHSNELKDLFTDIMRHDLLNPAGNVRGFTEILLEMEEDPEKTHILTILQKSSNKLIEMIDTAAKFAKLESEEELEISRMDIMIILHNVIEQFHQQLKEKEMSLELRTEGSYPAMLNPIVEEVFANFISNAIKYSPEGTMITIDVQDLNYEWRVNVTDQGDGIPDRSKPFVFDRFKRVDKKGVKGTGLGLAIVKKIAELLGGTVGVEDNPEGKGSIFWVRLKKDHMNIINDSETEIDTEMESISFEDTAVENNIPLKINC
ncbi:sensor histidine kinase [Methanolobus profundi]|uniref:histidine kinase n=1 Tax=Methanolobus profundi TaxID=487685 RepID=A0A1I4NV53_9EURY|nr:PAS domain S-box protein [Methanolobus profundi]SFM19013.1 PAS domain S-box-containing protein [Methanolobus profundi]